VTGALPLTGSPPAAAARRTSSATPYAGFMTNPIEDLPALVIDGASFSNFEGFAGEFLPAVSPPHAMAAVATESRAQTA